MKGYLAIILHAHLPYVRHPDREGMLEERWLWEALTDCYLPLLDVLHGWERDNIPGTITMSLTPTLLSMLDDDLLRNRYIRFLEGQIELGEREVHRTQHEPHFQRLARIYRENLRATYAAYKDQYHCDVVGAFAGLAHRGRLEIMASAATHGYLPLLGVNRGAARAQVGVGVDHYRSRLGQRPSGFWLPECGYNPGDDEILAGQGIRYFIVETHGITHASTRPRYANFAPVYCPSGVAAFGRDTETSKQVWSANEGYPGDHVYREFYRDIGYDLDESYLEPYLPPGPIRTHTGFKYYRITGDGDHKEPYDPDTAAAKAREHAGNFGFNRGLQLDYLSSIIDRPPLIVAPYDAELFGHWWYEGPIFLDKLVRQLAAQNQIEVITPAQYLDQYRVNQVTTPTMSSWGYRGYNEVWLEGSNDWIYRHVHLASERMSQLADTFSWPGELERRALAQAAREVLLGSASDWPFIMKSGTVVSYAENRVKQHINNFNRLHEQLTSGTIDEVWLADLEDRHPIFPDINYHHFQVGKTVNLQTAAR